MADGITSMTRRTILGTALRLETLLGALPTI